MIDLLLKCRSVETCVCVCVCVCVPLCLVSQTSTQNGQIQTHVVLILPMGSQRALAGVRYLTPPQPLRVWLCFILTPKVTCLVTCTPLQSLSLVWWWNDTFPLGVTHSLSMCQSKCPVCNLFHSLYLGIMLGFFYMGCLGIL